MSIFDGKSRYAKFSKIYTTTDKNGRPVEALLPAKIPQQPSMGLHLLKQGQRLDHLSGYYLDDPTGYWKIANHNDVMTPDVLAEISQIDIPGKG